MSIRGKGKRVYAMEQHGCTNIDERNPSHYISLLNNTRLQLPLQIINVIYFQEGEYSSL